MKIVRTAILAAAFCLAALPAAAMASGAPEGIRHVPEHTSSSDVPTQEEARALGRKQCQEFKANFADNRQQFGKCVSAAARVARTKVKPGRACREAGLSRKREPGEARSDFNACVVAAARGAREGEDAAAV